MRAFSPRVSSTVNIDVSASSQRVKICDDNSEADVRITNDGTATVWIEFGTVTATASLTTSVPVGPGVTEILRSGIREGSPLYVAAIAAGSTGKIYFTPGAGM
jgi:hypothetical protein